MVYMMALLHNSYTVTPIQSLNDHRLLQKRSFGFNYRLQDNLASKLLLHDSILAS